MDPGRGIVEDACGVTVHVLPSSLPRLELANDTFPVLTVRLQIGRPFQKVDRASQLVYLGADLESVCKRAAKRTRIPLCVGSIRETKPRRRVERILRESL